VHKASSCIALANVLHRAPVRCATNSRTLQSNKSVTHDKLIIPCSTCVGDLSKFTYVSLFRTLS